MSNFHPPEPSFIDLPEFSLELRTDHLEIVWDYRDFARDRELDHLDKLVKAHVNKNLFTHKVQYTAALGDQVDREIKAFLVGLIRNDELTKMDRWYFKRWDERVA